MTDAIETARLLIRPALLMDTDDFFALDSNPEVMRYLGNKPVQQKEAAHDLILYLQQQYRDYGTGRLVVIEKASGRFAGWAGLKWIDNTINGRSEYYDLGYRLLPAYWGKGIATEAAQATLDHGFRHLNPDTIYAMADAANTGSDKVLKKCGLQHNGSFMYEATLHHWYHIGRNTWLNRQQEVLPA